MGSTVSIPWNLRIILITVSVCVLLFVTISAIRTKMNIRYAILWFVLGTFLLVMGIFPSVAEWMAGIIGMQSITNFLFLIMIGVLFIIVYYSYLKMSKMSDEIKKLTYKVAEYDRKNSNEK